MAVKLRYLTIAAVIGLLALAIIAFGFLEDSFFPNSTTPQFMVHYWLPEGTDIRRTHDDIKKLEKYVRSLKGVKATSSFIGEGAPRYLLVYSPEKNYSSYALLLVTLEDYKAINAALEKVKQHIAKNMIEANPRYEVIKLGPGGAYKIEARFSGPDPKVLRELSEKAKAVMRKDGGAVSIRDDWRQRVKVVRPIISDTHARKAGVTRAEISDALNSAYKGLKVGVYREFDQLLPILSRGSGHERKNIGNIDGVQVWVRHSNISIPLRQLVTNFSTSWEDAVIQRRNKRLTLTTQCEPRVGNASVLLGRIKPKIEAIKLPNGYYLEWGGEYEDSNDAQTALFSKIPVTLILMIFVTVALFNALRQPLIIWLTVPLSIIGVSFGLLLTNESFGFMPLLGFLSLSGMLIKNAIVLIDEIDSQIAAGKEKFEGLLDASVSRLRPVMLAAITTILGMIPLLTDVFFFGMAVTIMFGLAFATILTLVIVPVFYATVFKIDTDASEK